MTDQDNLRDRIKMVLDTHRIEATGIGEVSCVCEHEWRSGSSYREHVAQAIIDEFGLNVVYSSRQHANGSALEFGETPEEYAERVRMKTIHKIEGRFSE